MTSSNHLTMYSWIKNRQLKFVYCCENTAEAADEQSPGSMRGKDDKQLIWRDRAEEYLFGEEKALQGKITKHHLFLKTSVDEKKILVTKGPLLNKNGRVIGTIGSSIDISKVFLSEKLGSFDAAGRLYLKRNDLNVVLSKAEVLVLRGILQGKSASGIAEKLSRSVRTVEGHIQHIRSKLQCETKGDIIYRAFDLGLLYLFFDEKNP